MTSPDDADRIRELERLVMVMAEKIWLMSSHLSLLAMKPEKRSPKPVERDDDE